MEHYADFCQEWVRLCLGRNECWNVRYAFDLISGSLKLIPWLNFNRCSTMRIRQGDLAVLFHRVAHSACIMRMSPCVFGFYFFFLRGRSLLRYMPANAQISFSHAFACVPVCCVHARGRWVRYIVFNSPPCVCVFSLTQPKGMSCPEKSWKTRDRGSCG